MKSIQRKSRGTISIFRPELAFAAGLCVVIGEFVALGSLPSLFDIGLGFCVGFFLSGSALVSNDYFDLEVDKINAPQRPLPAGLLLPKDALILSILAAVFGLVSTWFLRPIAVIPALVIWAAGFLYNWKLKSWGIAGNLIVSTSVGTTFVIGGIGVGEEMNRIVWLFGLLVFFFDLAEEIAGDAMDMEGDQARGSLSFAIRKGKKAALRLSSACFGAVILVSLALAIWGGLGAPAVAILAAIDLSVVYFAMKIMKSQTPGEGRLAMRGCYLIGSLGLLAFLVTRFF